MDFRKQSDCPHGPMLSRICHTLLTFFLLTAPCGLPEVALGCMRPSFLKWFWSMLFHSLCSLQKLHKSTALSHIIFRGTGGHVRVFFEFLFHVFFFSGKIFFFKLVLVIVYSFPQGQVYLSSQHLRLDYSSPARLLLSRSLNISQMR